MSYQHKPDIRRVQHCILEATSRIACTRYYRHFKGTVYRAFSLAQDSETLQWMVCYGNAHGDWVRSADNFVQQVDHDGKSLPRFEFLEEAIR